MEFQIKAQQKIARTFASMIERCYNSDSPSYYWYGARGIKICDEWLQSMSAFAADMGAPPALDYSIERIDYNGDYEPNNCRWATAEEQNNNTRRSKMITWKGKTQSNRDWAKEYNIASRSLSDRLRRGWSMERALDPSLVKNFEEDLAKRRDYGNMLWELKGKLYSAHSKQKRGHKLSINEQKAIEIEQENLAIQAKITAEVRTDLDIKIEDASKLMPSILDLHEGGLSIKRISQHFDIPLKIVDLVIKRNDRQLFIGMPEQSTEQVAQAQVPLIERKKWQRVSPEEIQKVLDMKQNGVTIRAIAKSMGFSKSTAQLIIKQNFQPQGALAATKAFQEEREYYARQCSIQQKILKQEFLEWSQPAL
jgi:hypothetical protein